MKKFCIVLLRKIYSRYSVIIFTSREEDFLAFSNIIIIKIRKRDNGTYFKIILRNFNIQLNVVEINMTSNTFKMISTDVVRWSYACEDKIGTETEKREAC